MLLAVSEVPALIVLAPVSNCSVPVPLIVPPRVLCAPAKSSVPPVATMDPLLVTPVESVP